VDAPSARGGDTKRRTVSVTSKIEEEEGSLGPRVQVRAAVNGVVKMGRMSVTVGWMSVTDGWSSWRLVSQPYTGRHRS
jgi:hypothetical protein